MAEIDPTEPHRTPAELADLAERAGYSDARLIATFRRLTAWPLDPRTRRRAARLEHLLEQLAERQA